MESANASGKLVIVPTPIGNLGDMTLRSLEALREADVVCAEDTRVTGKLLAHFGIEKRLVRLDEAMIGSRAAGVVERVAAGEVVAYCSDAGMPGVSDPGLRLVAAAREAGVRFVTGDTKVVNRGHGDGIYINTSGVGALAEGVNLGGAQIRPGDAVLVSGTLGDHGITIMSCREGLNFSANIESDAAPLNHLIADVLAAAPNTRCFRDPTRGGIASTLNELAEQSGTDITVDEDAIPVKDAVLGACEMLGYDVMQVANEGKMVCVVAADEAEAALAAMRKSPYGADAAIIGRVTEADPARGPKVFLRTAFGSTRILDMLVGEQLPRIC